MRELRIKNRTINYRNEPFVTAEIGHNHQGSLDTAKEMFKTAKLCGADAVKLQKRNNKTLFVKDLFYRPYDHVNSYGRTYGEHREKLEFSRKEFIELKQYARDIDILFICTGFDCISIDFLMDIDIDAIKIASGDLKNIPLLEHAAKTQKPIFVSTGGGTIDDVRRAYDTIMPINTNLCIMQCTASYPCKAEDMNLNVIKTYIQRFPDVVIGLSDHQNGIAMALVGFVMGAHVFEKHFTLNRAWHGTDHGFSLEPTGLQKLVRDLKRAKKAMGDGVKKPLPCEKMPIFKMGKKLVASRDLPHGHILTINDIAIKSPNDGLSPSEIKNVIGKKISCTLKEDENILFENLIAV